MIRFLRACLCFARYQECPRPGKWEREDQRKLYAFWTSETGKKLRDTLLSMTFIQAGSAVATGSQMACGYANGFKGALAMLDSHASPPNELDEQQDQGVPVELEHLSP